MLSFRKILPSSVDTLYREEYEYLLMWIAPNGGIRNWLFTTTEGRKETNYKSVLIDNNYDFRSVPNEEGTEIELQAVSLSNSDFNYLSSIFRSPRIYQVDKAGNTTNIAITRAKQKKDKMLKDFAIEISIMYKEPFLLNV